MRKNFVKTLEGIMKKDSNVYLIPLDVGFGVLEPLREQFPDRVQNHGISEQHVISLANGMAMENKIPFVYSINSFLVFKGFEQIRMLSSMGSHAILVGVGLEDEYKDFGITHYSFGDKEVLGTLPIKVLTPKTKEEVREDVIEAYKGDKPYYLRLSKY